MKKRAETRLIQLLRDRDQGIPIKPAAITAEDCLSRWLEEAARVKLRANTYLGYKSIVETYLRPAIGFKAVSKVTPPHMQALYNPNG